MDGLENDDPNTSGNNIDDVQSNFNDDEYDAGQDEDGDKIKYLKEHMNINNDTLVDIVAYNNVNDQDLKIFKLICNPCSKMMILMDYYFCKYKLHTQCNVLKVFNIKHELLLEKIRITWMLLQFILYQHMIVKTQTLKKINACISQ